MTLKRSDLSEIRRFKRSKRALNKKGSRLGLLLLALIPLIDLTGTNLVLPPPLDIINVLSYLSMSAVMTFPFFQIRCAKVIAASVEKRYDEELQGDGLGYMYHRDYFFRTNTPERFHNPDLDECWSANTPLFNVNEWANFIPPTTNDWGEKDAYDTYPPAVDLQRLFLSGIDPWQKIKIVITNSADEIVKRRNIRFAEINI
jgi:hypothetical protein